MQTIRDTLYPTPEHMKKTSQVSSRLNKNEQRKMLQQTILIGGGAIILFVVFLFVIVPGLIRMMTGFFGGDVKQIGSDDTLPPQVPSIPAPISATNSAQLKIAGYGEADSEVVILLNQAELTRETVSTENTFETEISLQDGENTLALYAIDAAGNESNSSTEYRIVFDNTEPKLLITEPTNGQTFETRKNQVITIKGSTDSEGGIKIYINGRLTNPQSDGSFGTTHQLQDGENTLKIEAIDRAGNSTETELKVTFRP